MAIERLVQVTPTPDELAAEFWAMGSASQAEFFNHLAKIADPVKFMFQLQYITDEGSLTREARNRMYEIGEYSAYTAHSETKDA